MKTFSLPVPRFGDGTKHDRFYENPGHFYDKKEFLDRGFKFTRLEPQDLNRDYMRPADFYLSTGSHILAVFACNEALPDENLIVFFYLEDRRDVQFVWRSYVDKRVYLLSLPYIQQITKHHEDLPKIFDSAYGRWIENLDLNKSATRGFDRLVKRVFSRTEDMFNKVLEKQFFLVEFHNGEVTLAHDYTHNKDFSDSKGYVIAPFKEQDFQYGCSERIKEAYSVWVKNEELTNHFLPPPMSTRNLFHRVVSKCSKTLERYTSDLLSK